MSRLLMSFNCTWKDCNTSSFNPNFGSHFKTNSATSYIDNCTQYSRNWNNDRCNQNGSSYYMKSYSYYDKSGNIVTKINQM